MKKILLSQGMKKFILSILKILSYPAAVIILILSLSDRFYYWFWKEDIEEGEEYCWRKAQGLEWWMSN